MRNGIRILLAALAVVLLAVPHPAAARGRVTLISEWTQEPTLAVDPHDPSTVVAGSNINSTVSKTAPYSVAYYTSHDGGRTFRAAAVPTIRPYVSAADPSLAIADNGTLFFGFLGEGQAPCGAPAPNNAILVSASDNHGDSFRSPTTADVSPGDDKPLIAVESVLGGRSHVFAAWTRFHNGAAILVGRSVDGGFTFQTPRQVFFSAQENLGAVPVVGPNHTIYVFWSSVVSNGTYATGTGHIYMARSRDDGTTFEPAVAITPAFHSLPPILEPGDLRAVTFVSAAITPKGRLYLTWAQAHDPSSGSAIGSDIMLTSSLNGTSWTAPERVNDSSTGDRFMPAVSALADGSAGLAFYDRRGGYMDVYAVHATLKGGFHAGPNVRVNVNRAKETDVYEQPKPTQQAQNKCFGYSPGRFFGDYLSTVVCRGVFYVTWGDAGLHTYAQTDIWLARMRLPRS